MTPLISIVVPIYNVGDYLRDCIESILKQSYNRLQIILIDDGSTDNSGVICDAYAQKDSRIEVIHQENHGLTYTRKIGLDRAVGKYIGFVDGDDTVNPFMYEFLYRKLEESDADFIHSGYYENGKKRYAIKENIVECSDDRIGLICNAVLGIDSYISPSIWSKLYRAEVIKKCYQKVPDCVSIGEDLISLCTCILEARRFELTKEVFYNYRVRDDSMTHRDFIGMSRDYLLLYNTLEILFHEYGIFRDVEDDLKRFILNGLLGIVQRDFHDSFTISLYRFPEVGQIINKKIILYGAGVVGKSFFAQISRYKSCEIVAWVDRKTLSICDTDMIVEAPDVIIEKDFDLILIALRDKNNADKVKMELCGKGVEARKILWVAPKRLI